MAEINRHSAPQLGDEAAYFEMEYKKAKKEYVAAKEKLKWIYMVKNCHHDVEYISHSQLITYECKKCKYMWYD